MKLKFLYTLILVALLGTACEEQEYFTVRDSEVATNSYVYFANSNPTSVSEATALSTSSAGEVLESNRSVEFTVQRSGSFDRALAVDINVSSQFTSDTDFANAGDGADSTFVVTFDETVTIPAGRASATFRVVALPDIIGSGDKEITFTIVGTDDPNTTLGFPGEEGSSLVSNSLLIEDDDCPVIFENLEGTFAVVETNHRTGGATDEYEVTIVQSEDNIFEYTINGLLGEETSSLTIELLTCSKSVNWSETTSFFDGDSRGPYLLQRQDVRFSSDTFTTGQLENAGFAVDPDVLSSWSTYNDEEGTLEIYGRIALGDLGFFGAFSFVFTRTGDLPE